MDEAVVKRIMPHSNEAEQAVIGSMMMDQEAITVAMEKLSDADFYNKQYGSLFKAMVEFDDYRRRVKSGMVSKKEWFRDFRNAKCKYYIGKRDIHPFLSVCIHKVGKTLHIVKE